MPVTCHRDEGKERVPTPHRVYGCLYVVCAVLLSVCIGVLCVSDEQCSDIGENKNRTLHCTPPYFGESSVRV